MNRSADITGLTLKGLFWMFTGTGLQAVLQIGVLIILARLLAPEDFGLIDAALVVVGFSAIFSQLGIGPAIVQRPDLEPRHLHTGFTISLGIGVVTTALAAGAAPWISAFFRMEALTPVLRVLSWVFLLQSASVVAESLIKRELRFRWLAAVNVISFGVAFGLVGVGMALLGYGVWSLVAAHLLQVLLKSAMLLAVQPHPKTPRLEMRALRELMYFGGGFTVARIANYFALNGDKMVVGRWLGSAPLGLFGRAYQSVVLPAIFFGRVLDNVLFPAMSRVQNEPHRLASAYRRGVALIALLMLPIGAIAFLLAPEIILLFLGPGWDGVVLPFRILALGMLFRTSYKMSDSISRATGAVYRRAWRQIAYAVLVVVGAWIGTRWGIAGVSCGVLFAIAANFLLMAHLSLSLASMRWSEFLVVHVPALLSTAVVGLEIWGVASVLREWQAPALLVLLGSLVVPAVTLVLLAVLAPRVFLGEDGIWMLHTLDERFGHRLPLRRLKRAT